MRLRRGGFAAGLHPRRAAHAAPMHNLAAATRRRRNGSSRKAAVPRRCAPATHHPRFCGAAGSGAKGSEAKGSARRKACCASTCPHSRSNGVPASRTRNRCALDRDMPAAFAARATLPVSSSAARKMRCLAGVQWARRGRCGTAAGEGAESRVAWLCSIVQDGAGRFQHCERNARPVGNCWKRVWQSRIHHARDSAATARDDAA